MKTTVAIKTCCSDSLQRAFQLMDPGCSMRSLDEVTRDFVGLFERAGVSYVVMGGLAVRLYALPLPTFDLDFTAAIARGIPEFYGTAETLGFDTRGTGERVDRRRARVASGQVPVVRGIAGDRR